MPPQSTRPAADAADAGSAGGGATLMDVRWAALTLVARFLSHGCRRDGGKEAAQLATVRERYNCRRQAEGACCSWIGDCILQGARN
jgi:hypothetical protein